MQQANLSRAPLEWARGVQRCRGVLASASAITGRKRILLLHPLGCRPEDLAIFAKERY
jgi:hypothetical protein